MTIAFSEAKRPFFEKAVRVTVTLRNSRDGNIGTGVVLSKSGVILTAQHVVRRSKTMQMRRCWLDKNGWTVRDTGRYTADVVYVDRRADIAIITLVLIALQTRIRFEIKDGKKSLIVEKRAAGDVVLKALIKKLVSFGS